MNARISEEVCRQRLFEKFGDDIQLVGNYTGMKNYADFYCKIHNYYWTANAYSVAVTGCRCPKCKAEKLHNHFKDNFENVKKYIEDEGFILHSTEYVNQSKKITVECPNGHIYTPTYNSFKTGHRCNICQQKINNDSKRKDTDDIFALIESCNFVFIEYLTPITNRCHTKIKLKCQYGHEFIKSLNTLIRQPRCPRCGFDKSSENTRGENGSNWQGGKTIITAPLRKYVSSWKQKSMISCGYKCVLTGSKRYVVHHVYSFNKIVTEAMKILDLPYKLTQGEYSQEEWEKLGSLIEELHDKYSLGVCLRTDIHELFHTVYGNKDNSQDQFDEFKQDYSNGKYEDILRIKGA